MLSIAFLMVQSFIIYGSPSLISRRSLIQNSIHASLSIPSLENYNYSSPILHPPEPTEESKSPNQIILNAPAKKIYFTGEVNDETCLAILQTLHTISKE